MESYLVRAVGGEEELKLLMGNGRIPKALEGVALNGSNNVKYSQAVVLDRNAVVVGVTPYLMIEKGYTINQFQKLRICWHGCSFSKQQRYYVLNKSNISFKMVCK